MHRIAPCWRNLDASRSLTRSGVLDDEVHGRAQRVRGRDRTAEFREAHERDLAAEATEGVHFERAWLDPESGKAFCLSCGPSKEAVLRVHDKAGHPAAEIDQLLVEVR